MASNPSAFTATPASIGAAPAAAVFWAPSDNALLTVSGEPAEFATTFVPVAGTVYLARLPVRSAFTITNLLINVTTVGVGASTGSFAGLYSSAGVLLSGSADIGAALLGTGPITVPLTTPQALAAGSFVWAAVLTNLATTQPTLARAGPSSASLTLGQTAAGFRFATNGTGQTTLAGFTPSGNAPTPNALLVGAT